MTVSKEQALSLLFNPRSVAVIGASATKFKGGNRILENLTSHNFSGKIYAINPNGGEAFGLPFYKSIFDVKDEIDIAIIFVPNHLIPKIISECIQKGIKGAIIQAAGFEEVGKQGFALRDEIRKITENFTKFRVVGPNCTGLTSVVSDTSGFYSAFIIQPPVKSGNIAVISQSGMVNGGYLINLATAFPSMGFRYLASIGNKMDLNENDFLEYYLKDPQVKVIAAYLEGFKDPRKFIELCQMAHSKYNKTIVVLKGGISEQGSKATMSHTGSLAENSQLVHSLLKQSGVITTKCFSMLFQIARVFSMLYSASISIPKKENAALITVSGGAGTVSADLAMENGLYFPKIDKKTFKIFEDLYPKWMPPNEFALIDLWPAVENAKIDTMGVHRVAIDAILQDPNIEGLFISIFCAKAIPFGIEMIPEFQEKYKKPVFCWVFGEFDEVSKVSEFFNQHNIPNFTNLNEMVVAYRALVDDSNIKEKLRLNTFKRDSNRT